LFEAAAFRYPIERAHPAASGLSRPGDGAARRARDGAAARAVAV
jgi:hypothetical protein